MNFRIVLYEPEIPNNTGNIGRTCVATNSQLDLIEPLGFEISDKQLRRAGLDYWPHLQVQRHANWAAWCAQVESSVDMQRVFYFSAKATQSFYDLDLKKGDVFVFGKESVGLAEDFLAGVPEQQKVSLPIFGAVRSLNVATVAAIVVYEGIRQLIKAGELQPQGSRTSL